MAKLLAVFSDTTEHGNVISGFRIMTEKEISKYEDLASSITWSFTIGASKDSLYYMGGEELLSRIEYREITKAEADTLEKLFGSEFGFFIDEDYLNDITSDDEETEYDEDEGYDDFDDED